MRRGALTFALGIAKGERVQVSSLDRRLGCLMQRGGEPVVGCVPVDKNVRNHEGAPQYSIIFIVAYRSGYSVDNARHSGRVRTY